MQDDVLELFEYAVENNLWDLLRGLYSEILHEYRSNAQVINYAEEAMRLMSIRMNNMRREVEI